jgi:prepilin-type processing-associated H-X9-DG protein
MSTLKADTLTASTTNGSITIQGNGSGTVAIADNTAIDGAVTINDSGNDVDFRVESDGNANMLFVDGGNNRVGIGTASPASVFTVYRDDTATGGQVLITQAGTGDPNIQFSTAATSYLVGLDNSDGDSFKIDYGTTGTGAQTGFSLNTSGVSSFHDKTVTRLNLKDYGEVTNAIGSTGGGTQDIDLTLGNNVVATVDTSANTFTFSNPTASDELCGFTLFLTNGGSQTVNWPAAVDWAGGTAPTLTTSGLDILVFITTDGGTIWHGMVASADSKTPS